MVAPICHELGHNLGFPEALCLLLRNLPYMPLGQRPYTQYDTYDVIGDGDSYGQPPHFIAVIKELFGWLRPPIITATGTYTVAPTEAGIDP